MICASNDRNNVSQNCLTGLISVLFECHPYALHARHPLRPPIAAAALPLHASVALESNFDPVDGLHDTQFPQSTRDAFNRLIEVPKRMFLLCPPPLPPPPLSLKITLF